MSFDALVDRLRSNPCVVVEGVERDVARSQSWKDWREFFVAQGFTVMEVDSFILWMRDNLSLYVAFENATIAHIKANRDVSAISVMDEIGVDHNRTPWFTRMVMRRIPAARGYYITKKIKRAA